MNKKNAGFSLVELIVVIAIMAVLVGVLAPAYLRYVEKSRKSADVSAVDEMLKAADTVTSDTQFSIDAGSKYVLTGGGGEIKLSFATATTTTSVEVYAEATASDTVLKEWADVANIKNNTYDLRSRDFRAASGTATGEVQANGTVTWTNSASAKSEDGDLFARMGYHSGDIWNKLTTGASSATAS